MTRVEAKALTIDQEFGTFEDYWSPFRLRTGPAGAYVASISEAQQIALADRLRHRVQGDNPATLAEGNGDPEGI